jgi:predicted O-methyltransferase YrrM
MAGDSTLGELAYSFTRALRPALVVETGVSIGLTSAYILAAMADNELGELHSIDIPPPRMVAEKLVGSAVPPDLRDRWHYHWGSARRLLPRILSAQPGGRRIFLHDSEHSYRNMRWELVTAWGALAPGDVILCDDANFHAAFVDAARSVGGRPHLIGQSEKGGLTGLLVRT